MVRRDRLKFCLVQVFQIGIRNTGQGALQDNCIPSYPVGYTLAKPVLPLLRRLFPRYILTTEEIGRAMIHVAKRGAPKKVLESWDIRGCATTSNALRGVAREKATRKTDPL